MIIDAHTHGLNSRRLERIAEAGGNWTRSLISGMQGDLREHPPNPDVSQRVELLDRYGFDYQVVTPAMIEVNNYPGETDTMLEIARRINDNMASLTEDSKGRLIPVGIIPLIGFDDDSHKEVDRAIKKLGLKGITVPSHVRGKPLDTPEFEPFWAQAAELGLPVFIHPRGPFKTDGRTYECEYDLIHNLGWPFETALALHRLVFSGIMERYPNLKIISHHLGGGMVPFFMGRTMETYELSKQERLLGRVMPKPLSEYFSLFYYDTAVGGSAAAIRCAYEVIGAEKLVFATDAPNGPEGGVMRLRTYPDVIRSLNLPSPEAEKIMSGNMLSLIKNINA
jgi:predicted TIM-barrel fold metal-dependent hydrolase